MNIKSEKHNNGISNNRFFWIDIAKAFSIFGVVYIHAGVGDNKLFLNTTSYFRFCVPIFIIISFFLAEYSINNSKQKYSKTIFLKKRLMRLMIPYAVWSSLYAFGQFYLGLKSSIDFGPTFAWQGQYFFIILIQLTIIFPWIREISIDLVKLVLIFTLTLLLYAAKLTGFTIPFVFSGQAPFFFWIFYIFLGIYIARNQKVITSLFSKISFFTVTAIIFIIPFFIVLERNFVKYNDSYLTISVLLVSCILAILFCSKSNFFANFESNALYRVSITPLSKYSLGIFCINPIIITFILNVANYLKIENFFVLEPLALIFTRLFVAIFTCIASAKFCIFIDRTNLSLLVK